MRCVVAQSLPPTSRSLFWLDAMSRRMSNHGFGSRSAVGRQGVGRHNHIMMIKLSNLLLITPQGISSFWGEDSLSVLSGPNPTYLWDNALRVETVWLRDINTYFNSSFVSLLYFAKDCCIYWRSLVFFNLVFRLLLLIPDYSLSLISLNFIPLKIS